MRKPDYERANVRLYNTDCLEVLADLEPTAAAVVTDPPYSSGGQYRGDRTQKALLKYVNTESQKQYADFSGDNRDQRSYLAWCTLWLSAARNACTAGAVVCVFTDWRQLPTTTDAIQCAGWTYRNIATWWKPGCRNQKGRFSSSAEFIVYGTSGPQNPDWRGVQNVFACAPIKQSDRKHIAEKPLPVTDWVCRVAQPGGGVIDPFMGSGPVGVSCVRSGRPFVGVEYDAESFDEGCRRIDRELDEVRNIA